MKSEKRTLQGDLKTRTKSLALRIIRLYGDLPKREDAQVIGDQFLRSGTSVGALLQRARSISDFLCGIEEGLQELQETEYWLKLLEEAGLMSKEQLSPVQCEVDELLGIFGSVVRSPREATRH